jgi:glycosyltransferase involved in cell wall biosynthesis
MSGRLLIVCAGGMLSGKEIVSVTLARELRSRGWDVEFAASRWGCQPFRDLLAAEGFNNHQLWMGFIAASLRWSPLIMTLDQLTRWPSLLAGYRRLIRDRAPDVVIHTNWHHALLLAPLLNRERDIYWSHELLPPTPAYRQVFGMIARRVARIACVSQAGARSVAALGIDAAKLAVVNNGTAFHDVPPEPGANTPLRLGIVGQIGAWKGHEDLLDALGELARRGQRVSLKVFGRGKPEFMATLQRKAEALQIADWIEWRGFVADQASIYREIDLCVIPSRFEEPFATSALEAAFCGRAVIATAVGGLPEIVQDHETGILFEPGRADLLADAIGEFLREPELIRSMGRAARRRAQVEFSAAAFGDRFVALIQQFRGAA